MPPFRTIRPWRKYVLILAPLLLMIGAVVGRHYYYFFLDPFAPSPSFLTSDKECLRKLMEEYRCPPITNEKSESVVQDSHSVVFRRVFNDKIHTQIKRTRAVLTDSSAEKLLIMQFYPNAGLGNRIMNVVAGFVLALLSDRVLILDWEAIPNKAAAFMEVFSKQPEDSPLYLLRSEIPKNADKCLQLQMDTFYDVSKHTSPLCLDMATFADHACVSVVSWHYFIPALENNPVYASLMKEWFEPYSVFQSLFPFLLQLKPELQTRVQDFKNSNFGDYTIGLHIRTLELFAMTPEHERAFWNCAGDLVTSRAASNLLPANATVRYYVATESACTKLAARKQFGCSAIFQQEPYSRRTVDGIRDGLVELYLLGECQDLILSGSSTYSSCAAGRTARVPYVVLNSPLMCVRLLHAEPVMHQWNRMLTFAGSKCAPPPPLGLYPNMVNRAEMAWEV